MRNHAAIDRLLAVMAALRHPDTGCGWDREQTFATIAPYTVEEAYEVADAIARGPEPGALKDELGDLLLQVAYHARMAEERGWFTFDDVAATIAEKMVRRHPHVFGAASAETAAAAWEATKAAERHERAEHGTLAGVAAGLPSLQRADKLTRRAARVGFDWPNPDAVFAKLDEEVGELRAELRHGLDGADPARLTDEMGDLLFVVANLARKLGLDPEACLDAANRKFARRFEAVEARLAARGETPQSASLAAMEAEWIAVKAAE